MTEKEYQAATRKLQGTRDREMRELQRAHPYKEIHQLDRFASLFDDDLTNEEACKWWVELVDDPDWPCMLAKLISWPVELDADEALVEYDRRFHRPLTEYMQEHYIVHPELLD